MKYLVIGAAGHAEEVAWSLCAQRGHVELLFFDDHVPPGPLPSGLGRVVGPLDAVAANAAADDRLVLGIGRPRIKAAVVDRLAALGLPWATVVHPNATVGPNSEIGPGGYVAAGAIVTVNVRIGRFATVNMHAQVAHDDTLADFVTLHPNAHLAGNVRVGEGVEVGTGASVLPGVAIGPWAVLGAGGVAVRALAGGATYVGVPARVLEHRRRPQRTAIA